MGNKEEDKEKLRKFTLESGPELFGVADISGIRNQFNLKPEMREKFSRGISIGKRLLDPVLDDIEDHPTPLYLHHYRQLNFLLDRTALLLASRIQDMNHRALSIPASQIIDWENQKAHLSHKQVGFLAGLGWIGRNNLLVNPEFGARFRLVTVLTDMPLEADSPVEDGCGPCQDCLASCPAQAIRMSRKDFGHRECFEKLKEFKRAGLVSQHICGVCVKACKGIRRS